jgi:pilus assembly protein CpaF
MDKFHLEQYLAHKDMDSQDHPMDLFEIEKTKDGFALICKIILEDFIMEWDSEKQDIASVLHLQKNAIIGYEKEVSFFKDKINIYLEKHAYEPSEFPNHYESLEDAIYQENWGLAGVSEWFGKDYKDSSSATIIGKR